MELYNAIIKRAEGLLGSSAPKVYKYDTSKTWFESKDFELVMARDTAYELGGEKKPAVSFTCVTTSKELVPDDEIIVYGDDLDKISENMPYARITLLRVGDIETSAEGEEDDTEATFREIQNMDFTKYHVFPTGYMIRTSSEASREQVRVAKEAVKKGITFEKIGNTFISHYKKNENVMSVKEIFVTAKDADYDGLIKAAGNVHDITMTLTKIMEGLPTDCSSCGLKSICDEVEGMKELHFGKKDK